MVTTRSNGATKQAHIEDFTKTATAKKESNPNPTAKGKAKPKETPPAPKKEESPSPPPKDQENKDSKPAQKRRAATPSSPETKKQRTTPSVKEEATPKKTLAKSRNGQTKLNTENVSEELATPAQTKDYKKASSPKAKTAQGPASSPPPKQETAEEEEEGTAEQSDVIMINRSPVLDLWAAAVAHFVHPDLSWDTCLSAGSAVASLCAVSKGRSIGVIDPPSDNSGGTKNQKKEAGDAHEIEVMGFKLNLKDGLVVVGKDKKKANEGALKGKYGDDAYKRVKKAFEEALETWKDDREGLNRTAFAMYEDFRPSVAAGQKGWGRKGELSLDRVLETIAKG